MFHDESAGASPPGPATKDGIALRIVRSPRARRYLLRLDRDGAARLVIPRRGSQAEAMRFLERSRDWLRGRHRQWLATQGARQPWQDGSRFLFRGERVELRVETGLPGATLRFAGEIIYGVAPAGDYREAVKKRLRALAARELPPRTLELARGHDITVARVSVRAQRTRWGSCSARGTISLNWRLIQAPEFVRDYLIVHELMHRRQMNHSGRYWRLVEQAFPRWREAEAWLKQTRLESLD